MERGNLVLTRKRGERIQIGDDITIDVVEVRSDGRVRLGISAPRHIRVDREEVRKEREQRCGDES